MIIRRAEQADAASMWEIISSANERGDTLPFSDEFDRDTFQLHWFTTEPAFVAETDEGVIGMYKMGANFPGRGDHVANATYVVSAESQGKGVGRALVNHSLDEARANGFKAMQFNFVVSTNAPAVELYKKLGFSIVGTLPKAFRHKELGFVDAYVMYLDLGG
ncbi:MAG: GNAT family N-acetyltransferase [Pyrinomonadaceae bacterium]